MRANTVPLGVAVLPPHRRDRRVTLAAGECGVKDQVSRTQPHFDVKARRRLRDCHGR
jgi:hypothetical protein